MFHSNNEQNNDKSRIISKGNNQDIAVILINCNFECNHEKIEYNYENAKNSCQLKGCNLETATLNDIPQLILGECQGKVTPAPLIPSKNIFTHSNEFTFSKPF